MKYKVGDRFRAPTRDELEGLGLRISENGYVWCIKRDVKLVHSCVLGEILEVDKIFQDARYPYGCTIIGNKLKKHLFCAEELDEYFTEIEVGQTASQKLDICRKEIAESLEKAGVAMEVDILAIEGECFCWWVKMVTKDQDVVFNLYKSMEFKSVIGCSDFTKGLER